MGGSRNDVVSAVFLQPHYHCVQFQAESVFDKQVSYPYLLAFLQRSES